MDGPPVRGGVVPPAGGHLRGRPHRSHLGRRPRQRALQSYLAFYFYWRDGICEIDLRSPVGVSPRELDDIMRTLNDSMTGRYAHDPCFRYAVPQNGSDDSEDKRIPFHGGVPSPPVGSAIRRPA